MRRSQLLRFSRAMQRVGKQKQAGYLAPLLSGENTCLPASVGVPSEEHLPAHSRPHFQNGGLQPFAVGLGVGRRRRSVSSLLPERQVAAEHGPTDIDERVGNIHEQGGTAISTRAVRKDKGGNCFPVWFVKIAEYRVGTNLLYSHVRRDCSPVARISAQHGHRLADPREISGPGCRTKSRRRER